MKTLRLKSKKIKALDNCPPLTPNSDKLDVYLLKYLHDIMDEKRKGTAVTEQGARMGKSMQISTVSNITRGIVKE